MTNINPSLQNTLKKIFQSWMTIGWMCVYYSGNDPTLTRGRSLGGRVLFVSLLHRSREHLTLEEVPNVRRHWFWEAQSLALHSGSIQWQDLSGQSHRGSMDKDKLKYSHCPKRFLWTCFKKIRLFVLYENELPWCILYNDPVCSYTFVRYSGSDSYRGLVLSHPCLEQNW